MMLLFEKGRRWWEPTQTNISPKSVPSGKPKSVYGNSREEFAKVLILQVRETSSLFFQLNLNFVSTASLSSTYFPLPS
jgi:hypothetical protein